MVLISTLCFVSSTPTPLVRNVSYSSPPRRPARPRNFVRSSSSPNTVSGKPSKHQDKKPPVTSPPRSEAESISPAPPAQGKLKRSASDARSQPISVVSRDSDSSSPTAVVIRKPGPKSMSPSPPTSAKRTGSESLSPSPPTSAAGRKAGSGSRFRKIVLDNRHGEQ